MAKKGERNLAKEKYWRGMINEFTGSGLSAAEFCRRKEISYSAFNDWRYEIAARDKEAESEARRQKPQSRGADSAHQHTAPIGPFVPVRIVGNSKVASVNSASPLELVSPNGFILRMSEGCSMELLASVLSLLEVH
jgi:hypothetical protein